MKITVTDGRVIAEAETIADVNALIAFENRNARKARTIPETPEGKIKRYKVKCPTCSKKVRYIEKHIQRNHPAPVITRTGV